MPDDTRRPLVSLLYAATTLLIAVAFLVEILRGGCPVP